MVTCSTRYMILWSHNYMCRNVGSVWLSRARPKTPSINDETKPTVHKIIPATCNVNSWEVEMVLERPTLLNAQELFQLPVHITLVAGILWTVRMFHVMVLTYRLIYRAHMSPVVNQDYMLLKSVGPVWSSWKIEFMTCKLQTGPPNHPYTCN